MEFCAETKINMGIINKRCMKIKASSSPTFPTNSQIIEINIELCYCKLSRTIVTILYNSYRMAFYHLLNEQ